MSENWNKIYPYLFFSKQNFSPYFIHGQKIVRYSRFIVKKEMYENIGRWRINEP